MNEIHILLFYKFVAIEEPRRFVKEHLTVCKNLGIFGKVLVATEGINGSISGTKEQVEQYMTYMHADSRFSDIVFKEDLGLVHPFKRMLVRERKEIIRMDQEIDLDRRGKNMSPKEFLELYQNGEDVIILDARNDYESRVGKFKNAITPQINNFREFPQVVEMLKDKKDAKIVTYCTGGIRCEKASAYLVQQGFTDVYQLEGGILTFGKQFPNTVWEGRCFVFDKRMTTELNDQTTPITVCDNCGTSCDLYRNCTDLTCNYLSIQCVACQEKLQGCCSDECFQGHIRKQVPTLTLKKI